MGEDVFPFVCDGDTLTAVKGPVVLPQGLDGSPTPIGVVVSGIRNPMFGNDTLGGQIVQLGNKGGFPPLLKRFLLVVHFLLLNSTTGRLSDRGGK